MWKPIFEKQTLSVEQDSAWTYLPHLDVGVLYGVGVTFDQLFHLPQVSLLNFLKLLLKQTQENKPVTHFIYLSEWVHPPLTFFPPN